jgi:DNA-binding CsgD family transcriptional regulator
MVRSCDSWGNHSETYHLPLQVLPPWYGSLIMKIFYSLLFISLLLLFRFFTVRNTRKKELRGREDHERELISLKNEKLQAEIAFKSKELANSTMAIIKKNEFLLDLKEAVIRQKSQLGTRFPEKYFSDLMRKIDENLSSQDDWKIFETNFEQAHEEFMKNLKIRFPGLTPGDMRLCAFLRMNLSSKEIAPLLGISTRGVENHRYRLRKKMDLIHDDNLIEIILKL